MAYTIDDFIDVEFVIKTTGEIVDYDEDKLYVSVAYKGDELISNDITKVTVIPSTATENGLITVDDVMLLPLLTWIPYDVLGKRISKELYATEALALAVTDAVTAVRISLDGIRNKINLFYSDQDSLDEPYSQSILLSTVNLERVTNTETLTL